MPSVTLIHTGLKRLCESVNITSGYHRLHAAWSFNFYPASGTYALLDTTGFMPRGDSVSALSDTQKRGGTDRG